MTSAPQNLVCTWLEQQCEVLDGPIRAVVLLGGATEGSFQPAAQWPVTSATTPALISAATRAIMLKKTLLFAPGSVPGAASQDGDIIACPVLDKDKVLGVAAFELECRTEQYQVAAKEALRTNIGTLKLLIRPESAAVDDDAAEVLDLVATCIEKNAFDAAARALLARFAGVVGLRQASVAMLRKGRIIIQAVSGRSTIDVSRDSNKNLAAAMMEAIELDQTIVVPRDANATDANAVQNNALLDSSDGQSICTIPIARDGELVGAFLLEHDDPHHFDAAKTAFSEAVVALTGALLHDKYLHDRSTTEKFFSEATRLRRELSDRDKRWRTAAAFLLAAFLTLPFHLNGHYRVTADATLEGSVQRVVASPVAGYVLEASARPGDIIVAGDLLARLDDRDLELERVRLSSETNRLDREYRSAIALHDSPRVAIVKAQIDRATAELQLTEQRLERVRIVAPMDGVIVNGDLSQELGAPVEKGQRLFVIAPLAEYRVMLEVDEREVGALRPGQSGLLALVGLPGKKLPLTVDRITPISSQADGRNFFLVEARLDEMPELLRPGMDGVAKVAIGDRRLAWIWAHELTDWLGLLAWRWLG